jgi:hypothetical protein
VRFSLQRIREMDEIDYIFASQAFLLRVSDQVGLGVRLIPSHQVIQRYVKKVGEL